MKAKTQKGTHKGMAGRSSRHSDKKGLVRAATEAVVELGHAAESLGEAMEHVKTARHTADPVIKRAKAAGHKVVAAGKRAYKSTKRAVGIS